MNDVAPAALGAPSNPYGRQGDIMAYQAIETKFVGPTNHRGARIRAKCQARTTIVTWDHSLGVEDNHDAAAKALAERLGWQGRWFAGGNAGGTGNVYVNAPGEGCAAFIVAEGKAAERLEIPAYCDRWMMGDRFGDLVKTSKRRLKGYGVIKADFTREPVEIAHVRLDKSGKVVRVVLADCAVV